MNRVVEHLTDLQNISKIFQNKLKSIEIGDEAIKMSENL